ncbi:hypothetical protein K1W54_13960 [Micromonospora sp. CPCC 205371]|nr:hypothetical protein [Micromonospora sp. CPCC 205371]
MSIDLDQLLVRLDPGGRGGRRHIDDVAVAVREAPPHTDGADVPELVRETIDQGQRQGLWTAARTTTVQRGRIVLPKTITLPRRAASADRLRPAGVPLRDELASWAANLLLSTAQRQVLLAVNDWLRRTNGGDVPAAEAAERAYELLGDEKAFDSTPPRGGAALWGPGRLTFDLLRCHRTPTPLTWEPTTAVVGTPGPIVCVENHATFRTLLRVLRTDNHPQWAAVAWVQGRNTAPLEALRTLPFTVTRFDYLGDLDPAGLAIAATACAVAERVGTPAQPAERLWELLVRQPHRPGPTVAEAEARRLVEWLPASIRNDAQALLTSGRRVPQEALRLEFLVEVLAPPSQDRPA